MRENDSYRDNLAALCAAYPDKRALTKSDLARYLGVSYRAATTWWTDHELDKYATRETIARILS